MGILPGRDRSFDRQTRGKPFDLFHRNAELMLVAVVDADDVPVGLVERQAFF